MIAVKTPVNNKKANISNVIKKRGKEGFEGLISIPE